MAVRLGERATCDVSVLKRPALEPQVVGALLILETFSCIFSYLVSRCFGFFFFFVLSPGWVGLMERCGGIPLILMRK